MEKGDNLDDIPVDGFQEKRINKMRNFYSIDSKPILSSSDVNNPNFDIKVYMDKVFSTQHFESLVEKNDRLKSEIKSLDFKLQRVVYENYSKFIKSTETIKKMRSDITSVSDEMKNLNSKFMQVVKSSKVINSHISVKRCEIKKLYAISDMLEKLHFVLDLPDRLKKCKEKKYYTLCVKYYKITENVLNKYSHLFKHVHEEVGKLMKELKDELIVKLFPVNIEKSKSKRKTHSYKNYKEYLNILVQLNVPKEELKKKFILLVGERLQKVFVHFQKKNQLQLSLSNQVQSLHSLFDYHVGNFVELFSLLNNNQREYDKIIQKWFSKYFETVENIVRSKYNIVGTLNRQNQSSKIENDQDTDLLKTFQMLITQFKTYSSEFTKKISGEEIHLFLQDKFMRVFSFILKDVLLQRNLDYFQTEINQKMNLICLLKNDIDNLNVKSGDDSPAPFESDSMNSVKGESLNFSNFVIQVIEKYTKKYKKFLQVFQKELIPKKNKSKQNLFSVSEALGLEFLDMWIEMNCAFIVESILKRILDTCVLYSQTNFVKESSEVECSATGALVFYNFCQLSNEKSLLTLSDIIRKRKFSKKKRKETAHFDVEKLSFAMYDISNHLVVYYVEKQGTALSKYVKLGIKLPNWKNEPQPRRVSHWCVVLVEELNQIWEEIRQSLSKDQSDDDDTDSTFSNKTGSTLKYYSTLKYGKLEENKGDESLGGLILDGKFKVKLSNRTFDIFTISVRDIRIKNIFNEINKIWLKELDELIRQINIICTNGLWQIQIDCVYLSKRLFEKSNDDITQLFNEALRSANQRCVNCQVIGKLILDKIVNEDEKK